MVDRLLLRCEVGLVSELISFGDDDLKAPAFRIMFVLITSIGCVMSVEMVPATPPDKNLSAFCKIFFGCCSLGVVPIACSDIFCFGIGNLVNYFSVETPKIAIIGAR